MALGVACVATAGAWQASHRSAERRLTAEFEARTHDIVLSVAGRIQGTETMLRGIAGLFAGSTSVSRADFHDYITALALPKTMAGIRGVGFARHMPAAQRAIFEAAVRAEGLADFAVHPPAQASEAEIVLYREPADAIGATVLGYDMWSDPQRRAAMEQARDSGEVTMSPLLMLRSTSTATEDQGFVLYAPVYHQGGALDSVEARRRALLGFAFGALRVRDLVSAVLGGRDDVLVALLDSAPVDRPPWVAVESSETITVAGRALAVQVTAQPSFRARVATNEPRLVALGGGLIVVLLFIVVGLLSRIKRQAVTIAGEMTREQRELNRDLLRARDVAEGATRARADFLARMSHELRTPLNGFLGMTELALGTALTLEQRDYLETARSSATSMLALVGDVLDFSKIDAGELVLDRAPLSLRACLGDTVRGLAQRSHAKGLELVLDIDPRVPDALLGDGGCLRQVIVNLVGNAIKFTAAGEVVVRVTPGVVADPDHVVFELAVHDTGIGIAPEAQGHIFRAFVQGDTDISRRFGGTGLGLTISAQLVDMMGGKLRVESEPGIGSTFRTTLRFERDAAAVPCPPPAAFVGQHALVIDDSRASRLATAALLGELGMSVIAVGDHAAATTALARGPLDVIVVDSFMPGVVASRLFAEIRLAQPEGRLLLLTPVGSSLDVAWQDIDDRARVAKPVVQANLVAALLASSNMSEPAPAPARAAPPLRLLVAEDDAVSRKLVVTLLTKAGHSVTAVEDGRRALDTLGTSNFDAAVLDVEMPELGGLDVARAVREKERARGGHLPLLAVTAQAMSGDRESCLAAGMDLYISKPIEAEALFAALSTLTGAVSRPPFDRARALAGLDGDENLLGEVVGDYMQMVPGVTANLEQALRARDAHAVVGCAHKLKGALLALAAESATAAARRLEEQGRTGTLDGAEAMSAALLAELASLETALAAG